MLKKDKLSSLRSLFDHCDCKRKIQVSNHRIFCKVGQLLNFFFGQILLLISIMEKCIVLHDIIFAFASISTYFRRFFPNSHKKVWHFKDDFFQKKKLHLFCLQTSFYCTISMSNLQFCIILGLRKLNLEGYLSIIKISLQKS